MSQGKHRVHPALAYTTTQGNGPPQLDIYTVPAIRQLVHTFQLIDANAYLDRHRNTRYYEGSRTRPGKRPSGSRKNFCSGPQHVSVSHKF